MKHLIVTGVATVALMAGNAFAGGGCNYGSHASKAAESETPVLASAAETDPQLIAKLQKIEEQEALDKLLETPVIHN